MKRELDAYTLRWCARFIRNHKDDVSAFSIGSAKSALSIIALCFDDEAQVRKPATKAKRKGRRE